MTGGTCVTATVTGVTATAANQNIELHAVGALTLNQTVKASLVSGTIRLACDTSITQNYPTDPADNTKAVDGAVIANQLSVFSSGNISLCESPNNDVNIFAATSTNGSILYHDANSFTVGTVTGGTCITASQTGVTATANGQSVELHAPGTLTLDQSVQVSQTNGTIRLEGDTAILQSATGTVSGDLLSAWSNGAITLTASVSNNVRQFAAKANVNGDVQFNNNGVLAITKILGGDCVTNDIDGVTGANVVINTAGANANLSVYHAVISNLGGAISLKAQSNVLVAATIGGATSPTVTIEATTGQILRGLVVDPTGSNNAIIFTDVRPNSGRAGELEIQYVTSANATTTATASAPDANGKVVVTVTLKAGGSTAAEILNAISTSPAANTVVSAAAAPGNSTSGLVVEAMDVTRSDSHVVGQTVNLKGQTGIGAGTIATAELEGVTNGHPKGTKGNDINWANAIGGNKTGVYVQTRTLNVTGSSTATVQGDVWIDVNPLTANSTTTVTPIIAQGNVVVTSGQGNNSGSISLNAITSNNHILVYTNSSVPGGATSSVNVNIGHLQSSLLRINTTNMNSIAVDSDGTLTKLANYQIVTGNMILLQLQPNQTIPVGPLPLNASDGAQYNQILANYNFFQINGPFPTPEQQVIRPTQYSGIIATYGTRSMLISTPNANTALNFTDIRSAAEQQSHTITIVYANPGAANQPLGINTTVDVNGNTIITISLATDAGSNVTTTVQQIVALVNGNPVANQLVLAGVPAGTIASNTVAATSGVIGTEHGFNITIDWGDPLGSSASATQISRFPNDFGISNTTASNTLTTPTDIQTLFLTGSSAKNAVTPLTISHLYSINSSATYDLTLAVAVDPSISLATHAINPVTNLVDHNYFEQITLRTQVQVNAIPNLAVLFFQRDAVPVTQVVALAQTQPNNVQPLATPPQPIVMPEMESTAPIKERYLALFLIPEDGSDPIPVSLIQDGKPVTHLDLKILIDDQLIEQFKNLPDGRYRLELYRELDREVLDERTILETVITNGTPSNPLDELIEQLRRTFEREIESDGKEATKQDGAALEILPNAVEPVTNKEKEETSTELAAASAWGGLFGLLARRPKSEAEQPDERPRRNARPTPRPEA